MKVNWKLIAACLGVFYLCMVSLTGGALSILLIYVSHNKDALLNWFTMVLAYAVSGVLLFLSIRACLKFDVKQEDIDE